MNTLSRGYTLLELIIVIAVIAVLSGLTVTSYNTFNEEKKLDTQAKNFIAVLDLAHDKAASADLYDSGCTDFRGYRVSITSSSAYSFNFVCGGSPTLIQSYTLPLGTAFNVSSASVLFKPLSGETDLTAASSSITIENGNLTPNRCINVTLYQNGRVEESVKVNC